MRRRVKENTGRGLAVAPARPKPFRVRSEARQLRGTAMRDGVVYVARGAGYLELAERSATSLRQVAPHLGVTVFTDQPCGAEAFDRVLPLPAAAADLPSPKVACLGLTPYQRTLFLDCDTLVLAPLGDLFDLLDRFDLALAHDVRRLSALIREGHAEAVPDAMPQMNSGVMLYRRSPAMAAFLAEWLARYRQAGRPRDQVTLRDLLWASDLRFYVLPPEFNLRRVTLLDAWEPLDARPTILHSHRLLQHMRGEGGQMDSLAAILPAERAARAGEWAALGLPPETAPGEDPVARFLRAEDAADGGGLGAAAG